jgi:8-oxo-dGTP pyrophosphatase MutT (NUDIX family)
MVVEYLLVQRKDSLGYVEFLRGKFSELNDFQLVNIFSEMTWSEKESIRHLSYKELWDQLWNTCTSHHELRCEEKFNFIKRNKLHLLDSTPTWEEPEWGFPKGRRNSKEKDLDCAMREFQEESGYPSDHLLVAKNLLPFEEVFTGSNMKSYKHRYYLAQLPYSLTTGEMKYQQSEIGDMRWCDYALARALIRPYNQEKLDMLANIHALLSSGHVTTTI